ncbi:MAG: amidohydrolase family protein [Planctomycetota bacterium]
MRTRTLSTSVEARWLLPVSAAPIERGSVLLVDDQIVDVGLNLRGDRHVDLEDGVLMPGLVNNHTHLEFSHLQQPLGSEASTFDAWIRAVIDERRTREVETSTSVQAGLHESERGGVMRMGEIATELALGPLQSDCQAHGVRFLELIGLSPERQAAALATARCYASESPPSGWQPGLSPHAPYTVGLGLLESAVELAQTQALPMAMHLAESRAELEFIQNRSGPFRELLESVGAWDSRAIPSGIRPSDYIQRLAQAPRALVIHGNYLDEDSVAALVQHRETVSLVYCPRTHAFFKHDAYPLAQLLKRGVRIVLGTDSRASNPDLQVWEEAKFVAATHSQVTPQQIVEMCTTQGSAALGVPACEIRTHQRADLTVVRCPWHDPDPMTAILHPEAHAVSLRRVLRDGEHRAS